MTGHSPSTCSLLLYFQTLIIPQLHHIPRLRRDRRNLTSHQNIPHALLPPRAGLRPPRHSHYTGLPGKIREDHPALGRESRSLRLLRGTYSPHPRRRANLQRNPLTQASLLTFPPQEYLYTNAGVVLPEPSGLDPASQCVVTARLYALGARLQARAFQRHALEEHNRRFSSNAKLPVYTICRLLKIVCEELPDRDRGRAEEDPLRAQIFAYTAKKMAALKAHPCFAELLDTQPLVGEWLCRWEGSAAREAPAEEITPEMDRSGPESAVV